MIRRAIILLCFCHSIGSGGVLEQLVAVAIWLVCWFSRGAVSVPGRWLSLLGGIIARRG